MTALEISLLSYGLHRLSKSQQSYWFSLRSNTSFFSCCFKNFLFLFNFQQFVCFCFYKFIYLLIIYFWLHWVFVAARGPSLVVASGGCSSWWCNGFSCGTWALGTWASVVVARGLSCSMACGIFQDQDSNPCPLHWQADS